MKRRPPLRESRLAHVAVGATMLAVPALVNSHDAGAVEQPATGQPGSQSPVEATVRTHRVPFGRDLVVTGLAPSADIGQTLMLEYAVAGSRQWRELASTTVQANGRFRLTAPVTTSGLVRVASDSTPSPSLTAPMALASSSSSATATATVPQRVEVEAKIRVRSHAITAFGGEAISVRGRLLAATPHRRVKLQARRGGRWVTLAIARTGPRGGFHLRYLAAGLGPEKLRVRFAGDGANTAAVRPAGVLTVYHQTAASWYYDGGSTACGFHAYYGVANLSLPCGAKVSFAYGGRTVTAVVDDRGPYVGGRTWDLNQNTAGALGVVGVQTIWSSS